MSELQSSSPTNAANTVANNTPQGTSGLGIVSLVLGIMGIIGS